jgi:hypothetical protein
MIAGLPTHKASEIVAAMFVRGVEVATVVIESAGCGFRLLREEDGRS